MGVSRLQPTGGANDFTLDIGSSGQTTFQLNKEYAPGAYSITSQLADASLDIYLINADGSSAGYTNSKSLTATKGFNKIVVYGATNNDLLIFEYKTTFSPTGVGNVNSGVAPYATSVSPSDLPDIDDTTTITGGNFSTSVAVTFTGTNAVALNAKNIVRASSTSLLVTRPDNLIQDHSPYDVTITNSGITSPSLNVHKLNDAITAGGDPTWVTASGALASAPLGTSYSQTLQATDPDGGAITYSVVTGSLPTGLTLNSSTGVISGTPTVLESQTFTVAATDSGGNITNRSFSIASTYPAVPSAGFDASLTSRISATTGAVTGWSDFVQNITTSQSTSAYRPTLITAGKNGKDVVRFSGSQWLQLASSIVGVNHLVAVFKPTDGAWQVVSLDTSFTGNNHAQFDYKRLGGAHVKFAMYGNPSSFSNTSAGVFTTTATSTQTLSHVSSIDGKFNSNDFGHTASNTVAGDPFPGSGKSFAAVTVGGSTSPIEYRRENPVFIAENQSATLAGGSHFNGDLAEILIYADTPNPTALANTISYLQTKWGIS